MKRAYAACLEKCGATGDIGWKRSRDTAGSDNDRIIVQSSTRGELHFLRAGIDLDNGVRNKVNFG